MPTTTPSRARNAFGFGGSPYSGYFPTAYDATQASQPAPAASKVSGLQRLMGQEGAPAVAQLAQDTDNAAQDAIVDFYSLNPTDPAAYDKFNSLLQMHRNSGALQDPRVLRAMDQAQGKLTYVQRHANTTPSVSENMRLAKAAENYEGLQGQSAADKDLAKAKAAQKFYGTQPLNLGPKNIPGTKTDPYKDMTPEMWSKGYHLTHDKTENDYLAAVQAMIQSGKQVDPRHIANARQILQSRAAAQMPVEASQPQPGVSTPQAAANAPTAPQTQSGGYSVTLPDGRVLFGSPEKVAAFKAQYGIK